MTIAASPTQSNILAAMASFLAAVLPPDVEVISGQPNRVPEPESNRFVIMSPPRYERIEFNLDSYADCKFTASIAGTTMTVTAIDPTVNGPIVVGALLFGAKVESGTSVVSQLTGPGGGAGTYQVSATQTAAPGTVSAGQKTVTMPTKATVQLDFHAADSTSGDLANAVSGLMRDEYGVSLFANQSPAVVVPLYADDARQMPFYNAEQQIEYRWVVDAVVQCNVAVSVPQQFADGAVLTVVPVA